VLATGMEDHFDSGWYFDAGQFRLPTAGFTHLETPAGRVLWSGYRLHEMDPLLFNDGFQFVWRNGDTTDPSGVKCMSTTTTNVVGNPTESKIISYTWVYVW
jgi:hypothetical protein